MPIYEPEYESDEEQQQPIRRRCRHIFTAGRQCGSPCLRKEQFCYYHHTTRRPVTNPTDRLNRTTLFDLPDPEDRDAVRAAVAQVMHAIARNAIDMKRAGMLLYSLQISLCALPQQPRPAPLTKADSNPVKDMVEETVFDDTHGVIAPEAEYEEAEEFTPRKTLARQLLDEVEAYEARQAAEIANETREAQEKYDRELQAAQQAEERRLAARKAFIDAGIDPELMKSSRSGTIDHLDASAQTDRKPLSSARHKPRHPRQYLAASLPGTQSRNSDATTNPAKARTYPPNPSPHHRTPNKSLVSSTSRTSNITRPSFPANRASKRIACRNARAPVYTHGLSFYLSIRELRTA